MRRWSKPPNAGQRKGERKMSKGFKALVLYAIWFWLFSKCGYSTGGSEALAVVIGIVATVCGWKTLAAIPCPRIFVIMPIVGWLTFFGIKLAASMFVGLVTAPYQIAGMLSGEQAAG